MTAINAIPQVTTSERDTDLTSVAEGSLIFNTDANELQVNISSGWTSVLDSLNSSSEQNVYVSTDGSNANGTGTISSPFQTIEFALGQITDSSVSKPYTIKVITGVYNEVNLALKPYVSIDGGNSRVTVQNDINLDSSYSAGGNARIYNFGALDIVGQIFLDFDSLNALQSIIYMDNFYTLANGSIFVTGSTNSLTILVANNIFGYDHILNDTSGFLNDLNIGNLNINKSNAIPISNLTLKNCTINGLFSASQTSVGTETLNIETVACQIKKPATLDSNNPSAPLIWRSQADDSDTIQLNGTSVVYKTDKLSAIPTLLNGAQYELRDLSNGILGNYTPTYYIPADDSMYGHLVGIDAELGVASTESLQTAYDNGNIIQMASGVNVTINNSLGGSVLEAVESGANSGVKATNTIVLEKNSALGPVFAYDSQAVGADGNRIASLGSISLASDSSQKSFEIIVCDIEDSINASFTTSTTFAVKESNVNTQYLKLDGSTTYIEALKDVDMNSFWVRDVNRLTGTGGFIDLGTSPLIEVRADTRLDLIATAGPVNIAGTSTYVESMPASSLVATDAGKFLVAGVLTGDLSTSGLTATLATVNANVGTFGDSTNIPQFTVNGKGLITGATNVPVDFSSIDLQSAYDAGNTIQLTSERNLTIFDSLGDTILDVVEDGANSSAVMYRKGIVTDNTAAGPFFELNNSSVGVVGTELGTISVSGLASDSSFKVFEAVNHEVKDASPGNYSVSQFFNTFASGVETKYMEFDGLVNQIEFYKNFDMKGNAILAAGSINANSLTAVNTVSGQDLTATDTVSGQNVLTDTLNISTSTANTLLATDGLKNVVSGNLSGDVTTTNSLVTTIATVTTGATVGTSSLIPQFTFNDKGQITSATEVAISAPVTLQDAYDNSLPTPTILQNNVNQTTIACTDTSCGFSFRTPTGNSLLTIFGEYDDQRELNFDSTNAFAATGNLARIVGQTTGGGPNFNISFDVTDATSLSEDVDSTFSAMSAGNQETYLKYVGNTNTLQVINDTSKALDTVATISDLTDLQTDSINGLTPVGGLSSGTSNSPILTTSTAEQSIASSTFVGTRQSPPNTFQVGDAFVAVLAGNFASANGDTLTLRLKGGTGSTTILSEIIVPLNSSSATYFELEINFVIRAIGAAGVADIVANYDFSYNQSSGGNFQGERKCEVNNTTFDTTILNELDITAQFSTNSANNSIETLLSTLGKVY